MAEVETKLRKYIGEVSQEECSEIRGIYSRMIALKELVPSLPIDCGEMYEKVILDIQDTQKKYNEWWHKIENKYNFSLEPSFNWYIDFNTNKVYLIDKQ